MRRPRFALRAAATRWMAVVLYALAMAYVEASAVLYLRTLLGGVDPAGPRQPPLVAPEAFVWIEIVREAATIVMLAAVGYLAGKSVAARLGAFALAMGAWDVFYYVFLRIFAGWPGSLLAPDVLFLIPLPWWGPVLSPVLVAVLIAVAGAAALARDLGDGVPKPRADDVAIVVAGGGLCLIAFMANALAALPRGGIVEAYNVRGGPFPWPIYAAGVVLGCVGMARILIQAQRPSEVVVEGPGRSVPVAKLAVGVTLGLLLGFLGLPRLELPAPTQQASFAVLADPTPASLDTSVVAEDDPTPVPPPPTVAAPTATATAAPAARPARVGSTRVGFLFGQSQDTPLPPWPDDPTGTAWFEDGLYRLFVRYPGRFVATAVPLADAVGDARLSAAFHKVGGPPGGGYGLIIRDQSQPAERNGLSQGGQYLVLEVGDLGEIGVWQRDQSHWIDVVPWTHSESVHLDQEPNAITVTTRGMELEFNVNGDTVASVSYTRLPATGGVGIFVGGDLNEVALEWLRIESLQ